MPTKIMPFDPDEISGVDHPATLLEGWLIRKAKEDGLDVEDMNKIVEILGQASELASDHEGLVKGLASSPLIEEAPQDIRVAADAVASYLASLGEKTESDINLNKSGKKIAQTRLKRLQDVHSVLGQVITEAADASVDDPASAEPTEKRKFNAAARQRAASSGAAMSDGSFPILTLEDLHNAIRLAGKAKDPAAAKRHIISRARALGQSAAIPASWKVGKSIGQEGSMSEFDPETLDDVAKAAFTELETKLADADAKVTAAETAQAESATKIEELSKQVEELTAKVTEKSAEEVAAEDEAAKQEELLKALPETVRKMLDDQKEEVSKATARAEAAEKVAKEERDERLNKASIEKAKSWDGLGINAEEFGPQFRELSDRSPELAKEVERILVGASEAVKTSGAFDEIGKSKGAEAQTAHGKLEALAKSVASTKSIDFATAYVEVLDTDEGRSLYNDYLNEKEGV